MSVRRAIRQQVQGIPRKPSTARQMRGGSRGGNSLRHFGATTSQWLVTEKIPDTPLARSATKSLSVWLSTTPSSVTFPFFTIIRIGLMTSPLGNYAEWRLRRIWNEKRPSRAGNQPNARIVDG